MPRIYITVRDPVHDRIKAEQAKEKRNATAEMATVLIEEALDARDKKAGRKS